MSVAGGDAEGAPRLAGVEPDPLVSNGLGSPLCRGELGQGELSSTGRRHCETSGFIAAAAPTGDYGIDVHIDTGFLGFSSGGLLSVVQDIVIAPLWMALVWAVHALVVALEWGFTIDLLNGAAAGGLGRGLRQMQDAFTQPWLAIVLAIASVLALYNGLIRRRVSETLGQALLMGVMMAAGIWVITDPAGTVGSLGAWANEASLGTLAVAAQGSPATAGRTLGETMDGLFGAAIEGPWCYLEFGDVAWCRDTARLDSRLRAAGLKIAAKELSRVGCKQIAAGAPSCVQSGGAEADRLERGAELLRDARSNGALFLALPANGPDRNSINESGSLLHTLCQSSEATNCHGDTASQAEFRTNGGTWPRLGGLLLIAAGLLGMLLLLGFIALRLLTAALFSLLFLLLAPAMVLTAALGDAGRAVFRRWATQLLVAVVSKLLFAFLLGVVLAVGGLLSGLTVLGWWTQWLLLSAFWWGAFMRRHDAFGVAHGALGGERQVNRPFSRRLSEAVETPRRAVGTVRSIKQQRRSRRPREEHDEQARVRGQRERATSKMQAQARRSSKPEGRAAAAARSRAPRSRIGPPAKRTQLARVEAEHAKAVAAGDTRRRHELAHRRTRIAAELAEEEHDVVAAGPAAGRDERARAASEEAHRNQHPQAQGERLDTRSSAGRASAAGANREAAERRSADTSAPPVGRRDAERPEATESSVMRDLRAVADRRKRQLGIGRD